MLTHLEWQVRVRASEKVDSLPDYCDEVLRGLTLSELVPESAWVESAAFDFNRNAECVIRWDTKNEMDRNAQTSVA
jgi:hypothetical protein